MARIAVLIVFFFVIASPSNIGTANGQLVTTTSTPQWATTTTSENLDATVGGTIGNPGAQIRFSSKSLDPIYAHALTKIAQEIKSMLIPDLIVPIAGGMLAIKSARITEANIPNSERQLVPPNRIRSRLSGGKIVSQGQWQLKPSTADPSRSVGSGGVFRTIVYNAEMNVTNQLGRTWDAKPSIQTTQCKADLGQFRVEIEGFGENTTVIDKCQNLLCQRIRSYFEDAVCHTARNYIRNTINQKLATFPVRNNLGGAGNRFVLDYGLLLGEPKVNEQSIQAYLEGDVLSRGSGSAPFYANELSILPDQPKMISFSLSDFAFNTLLFHAHNQQYRFSSSDILLPSSSSVSQWIKDLLKMNCSSSILSSVDARRYKPALARSSSSALCLGSIFENATIGQQFPANATGDLVFKSQRPLQVIVRQPFMQQQQQQRKSYFGGLNTGVLEAYGPQGADGKRDLLGRASIKMLRGDFSPKFNSSCCNITGAVNITNLQLTKSSPPAIQARVQSMDDSVLDNLAKLSTPLLTEMFNAFLAQFAQFPVPLVDGYECASPEFRWTQRTMQVDFDVRVSPHATRKG